ncbi:MAG: hypothetical protein IPJ65_04950 [Archangiaceae bacterium]|nr:hypothetical protein [Archangiaceae bacterium]
MRAPVLIIGLWVGASACSPTCPLQPGLDGEQCEALRAMELPASLPPSPTNARADDLQAAQLGFAIFFDARFSNGQTVRCANCHEPERVFADGKPTAIGGLASVDRNSPSIYTSAWQHWQTWDGKADSLWSQPLLAFENPKEMGYTRLEIAHRIFGGFKADYEGLFGALPALDDLTRFPERGKPGDAAFDAMAADDQLQVNRVAANVGKALEAYMRKNAHGRGRFDAFVKGDASALTAPERDGLVTFFKAGCAECHAGPQLTDDRFHALGVPAAEGKPVERARAEALEHLAASPFRADGPFSDDVTGMAVPAATAADEGAYHTPTLRNVSRTAPYGHNGTFATLDAAVDFHFQHGVSKVTLAAPEREALLDFLKALEVESPPLPWSNWPDR